jgi:hypothetical protein
MEDAQGLYTYEEEVKGLNINVEYEEMESNGQREREIMESYELVETMIILNIEV